MNRVATGRLFVRSRVPPRAQSWIIALYDLLPPFFLPLRRPLSPLLLPSPGHATLCNVIIPLDPTTRYRLSPLFNERCMNTHTRAVNKRRARSGVTLANFIYWLNVAPRYCRRTHNAQDTPEISDNECVGKYEKWDLSFRTTDAPRSTRLSDYCQYFVNWRIFFFNFRTRKHVEIIESCGEFRSYFVKISYIFKNRIFSNNHSRKSFQRNWIHVNREI